MDYVKPINVFKSRYLATCSWCCTGSWGCPPSHPGSGHSSASWKHKFECYIFFLTLVVLHYVTAVIASLAELFLATNKKLGDDGIKCNKTICMQENVQVLYIIGKGTDWTTVWLWCFCCEVCFVFYLFVNYVIYIYKQWKTMTKNCLFHVSGFISQWDR